MQAYSSVPDARVWMTLGLIMFVIVESATASTVRPSEEAKLMLSLFMEEIVLLRLQIGRVRVEKIQTRATMAGFKMRDRQQATAV